MKLIRPVGLISLILLAIVTQALAVDGKTVLTNMLNAEDSVAYIAHEVPTLARAPAGTSE